MKNSSIYSWALALVLGYILYLAATLVGSLFLSGSYLALPPLYANQILHPAAAYLCGLIMLLGFLFGLRVFHGTFFVEWSLLALLMYVLGYFLSTFDASFFTTIEGRTFLLGLAFFPAVLCTAAFTHIVKTLGPAVGYRGEKSFGYLQRHPLKNWMGRLTLAWMVFPVVYFLFGMAVAPIAVPFLEDLSSLAIPSLGLAVHYQMEEET